MHEALEVSGLGHAYGPTPVLDGIDLGVAPGELVAVLGASGCGKTTLLRAVAGLVTPKRGVLRVAGVEVARDGVERVPIERRRVGLVFQDYALFPHLTVARNVGYGVRDDPARVQALLARVGLSGLEGRYPAQLSGGQQQRVALARALAPRPELLLLDEPFANVDADRRASLGASLRDALADEGRAALLVTHDRQDALALADRVLVLCVGPRGGTVGQLGTPEAVYQRPASAEVAQRTGPVRFVPVDVRGGRALGGLGELPVAVGDGSYRLALRPEHLALAAQGAPGEVRGCAFVGDSALLEVQTPAGAVLVRHRTRVARGTVVHLQVVGEPALVSA